MMWQPHHHHRVTDALGILPSQIFRLQIVSITAPVAWEFPWARPMNGRRDIRRYPRGDRGVSVPGPAGVHS